MSFSSFSFDDADIAELAQTHSVPEISEHDKAVLALLKRLLQSHSNEKLHRLAALQQQLERDFLFWIALFYPEQSDDQLNQQSVKACFEQINKIMQSCKHQLRHSCFGQRKVLTVSGIISDQVINHFFEKSFLNNSSILAQLCEALPCVIGHNTQLSITAVNRFDERIELNTDDLPHMDFLLNGINEVKMDLSNLITLELGLPTWTFPNVVLHKIDVILPSSQPISKSLLLKQLDQTNQSTILTPLAELKILFSQTQHNAQQKIKHTKQQLSLLTKAMLNDDQFNAQEQNQIIALQSKARHHVSQLQIQSDDLTHFCHQCEIDFITLLAS